MTREYDTRRPRLPNRMTRQSRIPQHRQRSGRRKPADLQQQLGNRGSQEWVALQTSLTVGLPGDSYEREAEVAAEHVVRRRPIARISGLVNADQLRGLPGRRRRATQELLVSPSLETVIRRNKGLGQTLPVHVREAMEEAFQLDFSRTRIHTDAQSGRLNQSLNARAFTMGQDIFFGQGKYNPNSRQGKKLLAHELTHVVQQQGGTRIPETFNGSARSADLSSFTQQNQKSTAKGADALPRETVRPSLRTSDGIIQLSLDELNQKRRRVGIRGEFETLPATVSEMRDGAMYYDPSDPQLEALCQKRVVDREIRRYGNLQYIVGYGEYKIIFRFGDAAYNATDQDFLAMYRHERVHQSQYQALRRVDFDIARQNRALSDRISRWTSADQRSNILGQMVQMDTVTSEHGTRSRRQAITRATGNDWTNRSNMEVIAHATAFAQSIRAIDAAMNQLRQLVVRIPSIGGTPGWSYDEADQQSKESTIEIVLSAVARRANSVQIFNTRILRDLDLSTQQAGQPTRFLVDLQAHCHQDPRRTGWLLPDPEFL